MSDICKVCNGTGIVIRVDNYGVPDPMPSRCPACVTSTTASNTSAPTSDPEAAAEVESALRLLRELEIESCDQRTGHSQKWAVIEAKLARLRAEVQALREDKAMLDWQENHPDAIKTLVDPFRGRIYYHDGSQSVGQCPTTLRDAIRDAMKGEK